LGRALPRPRSFGISTHLYHGQRLNRDHLREIAAAGFDTVELVATRTHCDYHNDAVVADLQEWLADAKLVLGSVHAPVADGFAGGRPGTPVNLASPHAAEREAALEEATRALQIARRLPFPVMVVHAGNMRTAQQQPGDNSRDGARRSIEALAAFAQPLGVTIAVELIPNELSRAGSLVHFVEEVLEPGAAAICLDLGHAHLDGDLVDAIETVSEHIAIVHAHDNRGRGDDHLLPFEGTIDWAAAITALQKVGYDGTIVFEPAPRASTRETLERARHARGRMERLLTTW
jgi:sugar phosphate isomerase/epimerase